MNNFSELNDKEISVISGGFNVCYVALAIVIPAATMFVLHEIDRRKNLFLERRYIGGCLEEFKGEKGKNAPLARDYCFLLVGLQKEGKENAKEIADAVYLGWLPNN